MIAHLVFVMRALRHAGNENFPDTGRTHRTHLVKMPIPVVEITDYADALCIRRPDGETGPRDPIHRAQLCAKLVVELAIIAFAEEIEIFLTQRGQEGIRIA